METLIYEKVGSFLSPEENIGLIKLHRPDAMNALNDTIIRELSDLLDEIEKDDEVRVVVITADGEKIFSAGADLKAMQGLLEGNPEDARPLIEQGQIAYRKLEEFPKPTIAAINGLALAGGAEMALCCDIRVMNEATKIGFPETSLGLISGWGGTTRLAKIIGMGRAKEMVLSGGQISGQEAERIGLVNKAVPYDELESTWTFMATKIASNAPIAVRLAKAITSKSLENTSEEGNKAEADALVTCFGTEDMKEGVKAIFEKRPGNFKGK